MNTILLKKLGNIDQIAGIRSARLLRGRGEGTEIAEVYNASGLRFTIVPDRCMDLYDLSYKGINLSFHSQNGLTSPLAFDPGDGEFAEQWPGGALVTCGLDNVGLTSFDGGNFPTHGRISHVPASNFGTEAYWDGEEYVLKAFGEIHMTKMYTRHLSIRRTISTSLNSRNIKIKDIITNYEDRDEPYMILYHCNFGYPLLDASSIVKTSPCKQILLSPAARDSHHMMAPADGRPAETFLHTDLNKSGLNKNDPNTINADKISLSKAACGVIYNPELALGGYVRWDTENLPNFIEWKNMKSHDYVLAIEPTNTFALNRDAAAKAGKLAILPAYKSIETNLEIGVLDGMQEINSFIEKL